MVNNNEILENDKSFFDCDKIDELKSKPKKLGTEFFLIDEAIKSMKTEPGKYHNFCSRLHSRLSPL